MTAEAIYARLLRWAKKVPAAAWWAAAGSILTMLVPPIVKPGVDRAVARLWPESPPITIQSCAPLKEARTLISVQEGRGRRVIADAPRHMFNHTYILVRNTSKVALTDATMTVYPLAYGKEPPTLRYAWWGFTAGKGSEAYKVTFRKDENALELHMPRLNPGDAVLLNQEYFVPVGFDIEVYADGVTAKKFAKAGCPEELRLDAVIERGSTPYVSDGCILTREDTKNPGHNCKVQDDVPFHVTPEMGGKRLIFEDVSDSDPLRLTLTDFRPGMTR